MKRKKRRKLRGYGEGMSILRFCEVHVMVLDGENKRAEGTSVRGLNAHT